MNDIFNLMRTTNVDNAESFARLTKIVVGDEKLRKLDNVIPDTFVNGRITLVMEDTDGSEGAYLYIGNPARTQEEVDDIIPVPMGNYHICILTFTATPEMGTGDLELILQEFGVI